MYTYMSFERGWCIHTCLLSVADVYIHVCWAWLMYTYTSFERGWCIHTRLLSVADVYIHVFWAWLMYTYTSAERGWCIQTRLLSVADVYIHVCWAWLMYTYTSAERGWCIHSRLLRVADVYIHVCYALYFSVQIKRGSFICQLSAVYICLLKPHWSVVCCEHGLRLYVNVYWICIVDICLQQIIGSIIYSSW